MEQIKEKALKIFEAIFADQEIVEIEGEAYEIEETRGGLRFVDISPYRFIEQNPKKDSHWAKMAREGHQIIWVFKGRTYYARVMDGKFLPLKKS